MDMKYTAQEMRQMAGSIVYERSVEYFPDVEKIAAMLRQSADMMDQARKYEYSVRYKNGELSCLRDTKPFKDEDVAAADCICVRREVGEWEEVADLGNGNVKSSGGVGR